jgi:nucleoside 2-deoxyribosyltransferase
MSYLKISKSNPLHGTRCYLSGPIEFENQDGINWRDEPKRILTDRFGINVFDPHGDPKQQWVPELHRARIEKRYDDMAKIARKFVRKDLAMVDRADFLIAYLPHKVPTTGTHHEIINSNNAKKPTLLVTNSGDLGYIPVWYFGFIPTECMFPNWKSLYEYLDAVNRGIHWHNNRWDFIYGKI